MSTYIIAIGGTGAKFIQAVIHLAAAGMYAKNERVENLHLLIVDPDTGNGNIVAAYSNSLNNYQNCQEILRGGINEELFWWMQSDIQKFQEGILSPLSKNGKTLKEQLEIGNYNKDAPIRQLVNVLYTETEQNLNLEEGFRGRPVIGAAIIAQIAQKAKTPQIWRELISQIQREANSEESPQVFLCGSIFGGTGAAGFPTIGRLLVNDLTPVLHRVKLGGLLMLPYFKFRPPEAGEVYARPEEFLLKTEAALRYYREKAEELKLDFLYTLGLPSYTMVASESTGGNDQRNPPHFLELLGGLALRDFIFQAKPERITFVDLSRKYSNVITWDDLPNSQERNEVKSKLINTTRFAFAWLSTIVPELEYAKRNPREIAWVNRFLKAHQLKELKDKNHPENAKVRVISSWCEDYLGWLLAIHEIDNNTVRWFNPHTLAVNGRGRVMVTREDFPHLISENSGLPINKILRKVNKNQLNSPDNSDVVALAKALYRSIHES